MSKKNQSGIGIWIAIAIIAIVAIGYVYLNHNSPQDKAIKLDSSLDWLNPPTPNGDITGKYGQTSSTSIQYWRSCYSEEYQYGKLTGAYDYYTRCKNINGVVYETASDGKSVLCAPVYSRFYADEADELSECHLNVVQPFPFGN